MTMHFIAECLSTPWAMQRERLFAYASVLARRYAGLKAMEDGDVPAAPQAATQRVGAPRSGSVAVIQVYGPITQRSSMMSICDGGTSTQAISQALRQANADDSVASIVLDIDSPGGSVYGISELAAEIRGSAKPVTAIANSLAASAAYWIGAAASEFFVTPGGEVGSIGVWMAHEDWSKAMTEAGVEVTLISAGRYKVEGNPYEPLDPEAKDFMQSRTDDYYGAFTRDVAKGRNTTVDAVRAGMGQGRVLGAAEAKAQNMVDGVMTYDQVIRHVQKGAKSGARTALSSARRQIAIAEAE
jgi:signal peptide peptidase SppA